MAEEKRMNAEQACPARGSRRPAAEETDIGTTWPGDVYACSTCGCELRILKRGTPTLTCCGAAMSKVAQLNAALSF